VGRERSGRLAEMTLRFYYVPVAMFLFQKGRKNIFGDEKERLRGISFGPVRRSS